MADNRASKSETKRKTNNNTQRVEILLATYQSQYYLSEMLESLLAQSYDNFHLTISDDASTDDTVKIIDLYRNRFKNPVRVLKQFASSGSAKANFAFLMQKSDADIVLWADADDIWLPHKVSDAIENVTCLEKQYGRETPIYYFTDVEVVDKQLETIDKSYFNFKRISPEISNKLSQLLVCPPMLGCASAANRPLIDLAKNVPTQEVTGHDWWAILVAHSFGKVHWSNTPSMKYRLHGNNSSSQKKVSLRSYIVSKTPIYDVRRRLHLRRRQARALKTMFGPKLPNTISQTIDEFLETENQGFIKRRISLYTGRYVFPDLLRNIALFAFV